jgi:drug/metabolite transporter (DMT)-like permease
MNCCFAAALPLLKCALHYIDPFLLVVLRMLGAGGILCLTSLAQKTRPSLRILNWKLLTINSLLAMCLLCLFEAWALQGISATKANLMWATLPLFTALAVRIGTGSALRQSQFLGIGLGTIGMFLLIGSDTLVDGFILPDASSWCYDIAMFFAVCIAAASYLCTQQLVEERHPIIITNGISMIMGGFFSLVGIYCIRGTVCWTAVSWIPAIGYVSSIIIIVNIIGLSLQMWLAQTYSVTLLALSSFITPLCGALFGILQGDTWNHSLLGAALCIGGGLYVFYQHDMKRMPYATS